MTTEHSSDLRAALDEHLVPWWKVPGDDALDEGVMRRCLLCGRTSKIVPSPADAFVTHETDCAVVALNRVVAALSSESPEQPGEVLRRVKLEQIAKRIDGYCGHCEGDLTFVNNSGEDEPCLDSLHAAANDVRALAASPAGPEQPGEGLRTALLLAVEELDNSWTDKGDRWEYDDSVFELRLTALRRAYGRYLEAERAALDNPAPPDVGPMREALLALHKHTLDDLDVERLARAQILHYEQMGYRLHVCVGDCATRLAAAYNAAST